MQEFDEFGRREREGWADGAIVDAYVEKFVPVTDHIAGGLVSRLTPAGRDILDLCCGQGTLTAMLVSAGGRVTGLDFSEEMLRRAANAAPGADLQQGDAAALPFDDARFDGVVCNFGMMHLPDQAAALHEVRRVLRPGGRFLMATWAAPDVSPAFGTAFGAIRAHADFSDVPAQPDLFLFARPDGAREMMEPAGLHLVSHDIVPAEWHLSHEGELFEIFLTATVAASQLLKGQRPETVDAIRSQMTQTVRDRFGSGDGYVVPVPVAVVAADRA